MPQTGKVGQFSRKAMALERQYKWLMAVPIHKQALDMVGKSDFLKKGAIQEKIGHCFHRAAMQAESQEEFKKRIQRAVKAYEKAHEFYEELTDEQKNARMFRCQAVAKYLDSWLASDPSERKSFLDECLELEKGALLAFWKSGNRLEYGKTFNELPLVFFHRAGLEWDKSVLKRIIQDGMQWGRKAVALFTKLGHSHEIGKACFLLATSLQLSRDFFIKRPEKQEQHRLEIIKLLRRAVELSEKVGDHYFAGLSNCWLGYSTGGRESIEYCERAVDYGEKTRDNFLKAAGLDYLAHMTHWKALSTDSPSQRVELAKEALAFYDGAQRYYSLICSQSARRGAIVPPGGYAEHYLQLALWETDQEKRIEFLEKSEKAGMKALKAAEASGIPNAIHSVFHVASKTLQARAGIEFGLTKRRRLLEKALRYRERTIEFVDQLIPFVYWDRGVMRNYLAEIKAELAETETDREAKERLLEEAISSKEECFNLCNTGIAHYGGTGDIRLFAALLGYQDTYSTLMTKLYDLTNQPGHLKKAIEISEKAVESASKLGMVSRVAESYWKIAKAQDILGEQLEATKSFEHASGSYLNAAKKVQQLEDFYQDYASYMKAWSEIEIAKHHHAGRRYGQAKTHYENASDLHGSTERWTHLSLNYSAWAKLEEAEDLSRQEQVDEAIVAFRKASDLFSKAKVSLRGEPREDKDLDEKRMASELVEASDLRQEYCHGRIGLEEAKILDRQGNHQASSKKYASAAEKIEKAMDSMKRESDRQELRPIAKLCRAWQMMTHAEADASPDLYLEASKLFDEAKEHSRDEKAKVLALGHSCFCKALEAGTRFEATRDTALYSAAKSQLEAAANYYVKAGFRNASEYARATHRLFDAYMYMHKAETETEPTKKAQYFRLAEKLLQSSAGSYLKAKHPEKGEEVQRLLENVTEEQQLATSLAEVLHAPTATSTTTSFSTPTPTHEQAVGLERFEHADIQANLILSVKEANVGEGISFRIELINAGKAPALLIKVDEIAPEGFEIKEVPDIWAVEDSYLDLKGRRLNPLKTIDIKLTVKPQSRGTFAIKPRVLYIDETGKHKSHEPDPVTITVKELGIGGWIRGER